MISPKPQRKLIKSIIIDDEARGREFLKSLLRDHCPSVKVFATAESIQMGLAAIKLYQPDLVFLDIQMPGGTGFDLLEQVEEVNFDVIFTTAHDNYAIKAIKFSALDYLLKPIDPEELIEAVEKAQHQSHLPQPKENLRNFVHQIGSKNYFNQIGLPTIEGLIFTKVEDIIRVQGEGSYSRVFLITRESVMVSKNLKEMEGLLDDHGFFRVHKSHLINLNQIKRYVRGSGGFVIMSDGTEVEIAKRKKEVFMEKLS